jgi:tripartite-type tricarboxylate transporter receptor subunit TctC
MKRILIMVLTLLMPVPVFAWEPTDTIKAIIPYGPGSGNEILFRKYIPIIRICFRKILIYKIF